MKLNYVSKAYFSFIKPIKDTTVSNFNLQQKSKTIIVKIMNNMTA